MLLAGQADSLKGSNHLHPADEQNAIVDGYLYYYEMHPTDAADDGISVPSGFSVRWVKQTSPR
jgi:hypothetical protein